MNSVELVCFDSYKILYSLPSLIYKQSSAKTAVLAEKYLPFSDMALLSVSEHRELFATAGYSDIQVIEERRKGVDLRDWQETFRADRI